MFEPLPAPMEDYATADHQQLTELDGVTYHKLELVIKRAGGQYLGIYCQLKDWDRTAAGRISALQYLADQQQAQLTLLAERAERAQAEADRLSRQLNNAMGDRDLGQQALLDTVKRFGESNKQLQNERDSLRVAVDELRRELSGLVPLMSVPFTQEVNEIIVLAPEVAADPPEPEHIPLRLLANDPHATIPCRYGCGVLFLNNAGRGSHERRVHGSVWQDAPEPTKGEGWRCPMCYSSAHAQSVSRPDRCVRCANRSELAQHAAQNGVAA